MPTKLSYEATFHCSLERLVSVLYSDDDTFYKRYHIVCNKDENAEVGSWDPRTHSRVLKFSPNLPLPSIVKRSIGLQGNAAMRVQEQQTLEYQPGATSATIVSVSAPLLNGGERFQTKIRIEYNEPQAAMCNAVISVDIQVQVWGVSAVLEGFMVETAGKAFLNFLEFTHGFLADTGLTIPKAVAPVEADEFYDAVDDNNPDDQAQLLAIKGWPERLNFEKETPMEPSSSWFTHFVVRNLSQSRVFTSALRETVMTNDVRLRRLEVELARVKVGAQRSMVYHKMQFLVMLSGIAYFSTKACLRANLQR
mmetsp:Transcript_13187/g.25177  ORF Transcript_13187/g.25177 Transcript_13187/m.25177 type:complete len:308 (+) Transcript_13187:240-1163(+)|eukprot:CAMPEP_0114234946 /NCGR_PEP_ID=MMETSP0058-20121206/5978_1 /TAXON_ID=36894 /ORGANISM="Pyramimonas parkeae, CCMP726" /LENGTH=307 /DNA_ID=CAMNT_0001346655 /DNA_START=204 /DNA_END=1127 /DNA_ORIENTATION=+